MTSIHSAPRWARILPASLVAASVLIAVAMPAEAVALRSSFAQTTPIFLGDGTQGGANTTDLTIPDGKASLYPSEVVISQAARITDVNVVLDGLTHTYPDDLEVMLVGPGGQQVVLMNDAGGSGDLTAKTLVFDDEEGYAIPDDGQLGTSTVRPASYGPLLLTAPAPTPTGNTSLSVFDGTLANGTWKLFVYDDDPGSVGALDAWGLVLETQTVPYPSEVSVSGIGPITDLDVRLDDLTASYPTDVDLLLVGPQGQQSTLMSDTGGYDSVSDVDLTLDDEASAEMSRESTLTSGSFRPTNVPDSSDVYPAPAPTPSGSTALSVFDGTDPNGLWRLFASDTVTGDFAEIGGWSLDIAWNDAAGPVGSISINGGATTTTSTAVTLSLAATDPAPGNGVKQMRFSNDGTTYSALQPFSSTAAWSLAAGAGAKKVYAQFVDGVGNISTVSDEITVKVSDDISVDATGPSAKKFKPGKNVSGVKPTAKVKVFAAEALAPASVTKASVVLKKGHTKVKAKVSYDTAKRLIVLKPKRALKKGTYQVTVTAKVTDIAGNSWDQLSKPGAQPLKWSFKV